MADAQIYFINYDPIGEIVLTGGVLNGHPAPGAPAGGGQIMSDTVANGAAQYVKNGVVIDRPVLTLPKTTLTADGKDSIELDGLPDGATARLEHTDLTITGGKLVITTTTPGRLMLRVSAWPAQMLFACLACT